MLTSTSIANYTANFAFVKLCFRRKMHRKRTAVAAGPFSLAARY